MNILSIDFYELYRRHLCRHSEYGINVLHLISVVGIYISLYGVALEIPGGTWIVGGFLAVYFLVLLLNIPFKVWLANLVSVLLLLGVVLAMPDLPVWAHLLLILFWHRFQIWNHSVYVKEFDMSEFKEKYKKGLTLFFLLAVYELPILLNYLLFDSKRTPV